MKTVACGTVTKAVQSQILGLVVVVVAIPAVAQEQQSQDASSSNRIVVVSVVDRQLAVVESGIVIARFPVAVGAPDSPSPSGAFRIISRVTNPTYYHPGAVIPSGKNNPVGTRWLGLSQKGYGIHGTNAPRSIGRAASHGCIRLRNREMERLFSLVRIGDAVEIHGERDERITQVFGDANEETVVAESASAFATGGQE